MVSLKITNEILRKHKEYLLRDKTLTERVRSVASVDVEHYLHNKGDGYVRQSKDFLEWICREYEGLKNGESIFLDKPEQLLESVHYVEEQFNHIVELFQGNEKVDGKNSYADLLIKAIGYETFVERKPVDLRKAKHHQKKVVTIHNYSDYVDEERWSAYNFVMELGLKVCPYCNRSFITPIYSASGKARGDLDHFLPKAQYPYLSMSIYNLIPCCKICNSSLKSSTDFSFENNLNLYEAVKVEDLYHFTYPMVSYESFYGEDSMARIEIDYKEDAAANRLKKNNEEFQIEELYQYHIDEVKKLILKRMIYTDEYIDSLTRSHEALFSSREEVVSLLTDIVENEEIKNSILGKLKSDIAEELGF